MKTSELYELIRQYEAETTRLNEEASFDALVARTIGYYVDWASMVKH